jgi:hypothetical protein
MTAMETTTGPNADLFVAVLAQIEKHPETWVQDFYRCDSGRCFAGWATELSGVPWLQPDVLENSFVIFKGRAMSCRGAAMALLGIDFQSSLRLFSGANTLHDLYRQSAELMRVAVTELREKVAAVVADGATQAVQS